MNSKILTITGISGVGKSFLLNEVLKMDPVLYNAFTIVEFGSLRRNYLKENNIPSEEITLTSLEVITNDIISKIDSSKPIILISHLLFKTGPYFLLSPTNEEKFSPNQYVLIEGDPKKIIDWKENDETRTRERLSVEQILFMQALLNFLIIKLSSEMNVDLVRIKNNSFSADKLCETLHLYLKKISHEQKD